MFFYKVNKCMGKVRWNKQISFHIGNHKIIVFMIITVFIFFLGCFMNMNRMNGPDFGVQSAFGIDLSKVDYTVEGTTNYKQ